MRYSLRLSLLMVSAFCVVVGVLTYYKRQVDSIAFVTSEKGVSFAVRSRSTGERYADVEFNGERFRVGPLHQTRYAQPFPSQWTALDVGVHTLLLDVPSHFDIDARSTAMKEGGEFRVLESLLASSARVVFDRNNLEASVDSFDDRIRQITRDCSFHQFTSITDEVSRIEVYTTQIDTDFLDELKSFKALESILFGTTTLSQDHLKRLVTLQNVNFLNLRHARLPADAWISLGHAVGSKSIVVGPDQIRDIEASGIEFDALGPDRVKLIVRRDDTW